jgi:hypothetical protein
VKSNATITNELRRWLSQVRLPTSKNQNGKKKINPEKKIEKMENKLRELASKGILVPRTENNPYLKMSYKGAGNLVSDKWNIKIYTSGAIVCNDNKTLQDLLHDRIREPDPTLKLIQIDDAGGGFPLCGVMIGIALNNEVYTDTVGVDLFQEPKYSKRLYLKEYAKKGLQILQTLGACPKTHRIEICTGFINRTLRDDLRAIGHDVRVTEIKGILQDRLEVLFKEYVLAQTGKDLAYDPKALSKGSIGQAYYKVLNWGKENTPHLLKSGWGSLKS